MVSGLQTLSPGLQVAVASVDGEHRTAGVAATDDLRRVDVEIRISAVALGAGVADVDRDGTGQPPFDEQVPRLERSAIDVSGLGRPHVDVRWQRDAAAAQIRSGEERNTLIDRAVGLERLVVDEAVGDRRRVEPAQRARPADRVVSNAVARAEDRVVVPAVNHPDAGREVVLRRRQSDVLRIAAQAADDHGLRGDIHSLEATVGAGHDRVVLPTDAEIQGQLVGHVPTIADEEPVLPLAAGHLLVLNALADGARQCRAGSSPTGCRSCSSALRRAAPSCCGW